MNHPIWRCHGCGERVYEHVEGGYWCPNCGRRYTETELEGDSG